MTNYIKSRLLQVCGFYMHVSFLSVFSVVTEYLFCFYLVFLLLVSFFSDEERVCQYMQ